MADLDTAEAVIRWMSSKCAYGPVDWQDDTADTAAYIAECVRLRQAWENIQAGPYTHAQLVRALCHARKRW